MSANGISHLQYKADRQEAKLALAAADRAASGRRSNLDISQLPTVYADGDNDTSHVVDNPNVGGLVIGRPWISGPPVPTYNVVPRNSSVNEGGNITVDIYTTNVETGTLLYFTVSGVTNLDISSGVLPSGDTTVVSGESAVSFNIAEDLTTEGTETLVFEVRTGSTSGPIVATANITINDTSTTPDYLIMNLDGTNPGGISLTAYSNGTGQDGNGYYIELNRNYAPYLVLLDGDFTGWSVSGGENNISNVPITSMVPSNFQNIAPLGAIYIAVNPGNNSQPFTLIPPVLTWNDQTSHSNNGTLVNGPTYNTSFGGYFAFDGSNDYISLPSNFIDWVNTPLTVSIWFRTSTSGIILSQNDNASPLAGSGYCPAIYINSLNNIGISVFYHNSGNPPGIAGLADGNWHNMTITYSSGTQTVYVDGVLRLVTPGLSQTGYASNYYYYLGAGQNSGWALAGSQYFTGDIASFKVWTNAMSDGEATAEFDNTKSRFTL